MFTSDLTPGSMHHDNENTVYERDSWVDDAELHGVVLMLATCTAGLPDANAGPGESQSVIGADGVGSNRAEAYVNETFALRDFCWCDGAVHPEIVDWDADDSDYPEMPPSGGTSSGCHFNFEHFASGITAEWYKYLGRDMLFNRRPQSGEALAILTDCLRSIPKDELKAYPSIREDQRRAWGWTTAVETPTEPRSRLLK